MRYIQREIQREMTDWETQITIKPKNRAVPRNSTAMVFFRPMTSMITRVIIIPGGKRREVVSLKNLVKLVYMLFTGKLGSCGPKQVFIKLHTFIMSHMV